MKYFGNKGFAKVSENTYNVKRIYCIISKELPLQIKIAVSILHDFTWSLSAKNETVSCDNLNLKNQADKLTDENVEKFADFIVNIKLCQGIKGYEDVLRDGLDLKQTFQGEDGEVVAYAEDEVTGCRLTQENFTVVRHKDCQILYNNDLCTPCGNYQCNMRVNRHRVKLKELPSIHGRRVSDSSPINVKHLTREELEERYINAQKVKRESVSIDK